MWKAAQEKMQNEILTDPRGYWFLNILATHPDSQKKGLGAALVKKVVKMVAYPGFLISWFNL